MSTGTESAQEASCVYLMAMGAICNRREINNMESRGLRPGFSSLSRNHLAADLWNARRQLLSKGDVLSYRTFRRAYLGNLDTGSGADNAAHDGAKMSSDWSKGNI